MYIAIVEDMEEPMDRRTCANIRQKNSPHDVSLNPSLTWTDKGFHSYQNERGPMGG